jgi:hypothetical protein
MTSIDILEFELFNIKPNSSILVIGANIMLSYERFMLTLLEHYKTIPAIVVFSKHDFYKHRIPDMFINKSYDGNIIERIFQRQQIVHNNDKIKNPKVIIIIDDLDYDDYPNLQNLLATHRCYNITLIVSIASNIKMKNNKIFSNDFMTNFDYKFICPQQNKKEIYNYFQNHFINFQIY